MAFPISAALLDACVLALLKRGDSYGYEMTQLLQERLQVSESTLYPVLRRLQSAGLLHTYDQPYQGRNRRYYSITDAGTAQLNQYRDDWDTFKAQIDSLLAGEVDELLVIESDENAADKGTGEVAATDDSLLADEVDELLTIDPAISAETADGVLETTEIGEKAEVNEAAEIAGTSPMSEEELDPITNTGTVADEAKGEE